MNNHQQLLLDRPACHDEIPVEEWGVLVEAMHQKSGIPEQQLYMFWRAYIICAKLPWTGAEPISLQGV